MRRSYIQPSHHNHNHQAFPHKHGKEESNNLREKRNPASSTSSSSQGAEKKETKKLERMPTEEDMNASAEAFIKNFRQHLQLQRLQSIENYEQMLARGQ